MPSSTADTSRLYAQRVMRAKRANEARSYCGSPSIGVQVVPDGRRGHDAVDGESTPIMIHAATGSAATEATGGSSRAKSASDSPPRPPSVTPTLVPTPPSSLRDGPLPKRVASFDLALNSTTEVPRDQLSPILPSPLTRHANNPWESLREASPLITTLSAIVVATWAWGILQLAEVARKQMLR